jgi:hypothetical protein
VDSVLVDSVVVVLVGAGASVVEPLSAGAGVVPGVLAGAAGAGVTGAVVVVVVVLEDVEVAGGSLAQAARDKASAVPADIMAKSFKVNVIALIISLKCKW